MAKTTKIRSRLYETIIVFLTLKPPFEVVNASQKNIVILRVVRRGP